jgi:hypothetical protein
MSRARKAERDARRAMPPHPEKVRVQTRIPPGYREGLFPLRWQDETSGQLPAAVRALISAQLGEGPEPSSEQLSFLLDYLRHFICAPCWNITARESRDHGSGELAAELIQLRLDIAVDCTLKTSADVGLWINRCLQIGIDPL